MSRLGLGSSSITVVAVNNVGFSAAVSANRKTLLNKDLDGDVRAWAH
jgi:hypothetical protein